MDTKAPEVKPTDPKLEAKGEDRNENKSPVAATNVNEVKPTSTNTETSKKEDVKTDLHRDAVEQIQDSSKPKSIQ